MKYLRVLALSCLCVLTVIGSVSAVDNQKNNFKLGFGFDRDFGLAASLGDFNGFLGNQGVAVDYIFHREPLKLQVKGPVFWYVGAGGYGDWDGDLGVRLPVGAYWYFAEKLDAFAQVIPRLQVDHGADFGLDFGIGVRYQF